MKAMPGVVEERHERIDRRQEERRQTRAEDEERDERRGGNDRDEDKVKADGENAARAHALQRLRRDIGRVTAPSPGRFARRIVSVIHQNLPFRWFDQRSTQPAGVSRALCEWAHIAIMRGALI
jgi:hypothetical protein